MYDVHDSHVEWRILLCTANALPRLLPLLFGSRLRVTLSYLKAAPKHVQLSPLSYTYTHACTSGFVA